RSMYILYPSFAASIFLHAARKRSSLFFQSDSISHDLDQSSIIPPHLSPLKFTLGGGRKVLRIVFQPGALSDVYRVSLQSLRNTIQGMKAILGEEEKIGELDTLFLSSPMRQIRAFEDQSLFQKNTGYTGRDLFQMILQTCQQHFFLLNVQELAHQLNLSRRHLNRLTHRVLGFSAKECLRVIRFTKVLQLLHAKSTCSLPQVALQCGYADQPHFCHEFKAMTELTPKVYLKLLQRQELTHLKQEFLHDGLCLTQNQHVQEVFAA
ncbi:MAG: helix-turn-helix domain-containing protein, partial [Bacteroidota bacterium]